MHYKSSPRGEELFAALLIIGVVQDGALKLLAEVEVKKSAAIRKLNAIKVEQDRALGTIDEEDETPLASGCVRTF